MSGSAAPAPRPAGVPGRTTVAHLRGDLEGPPSTHPSPDRGHPCGRAAGRDRRAALCLGALRRAGMGARPRPPAAGDLFRAISPDLLPTVHTLCAKKPLFSFLQSVSTLLNCFSSQYANKSQVRRQQASPVVVRDAAPPTPSVDCSAEGAASAGGGGTAWPRPGPAPARTPDSRSCSSPATASGVAGPGKRASRRQGGPVAYREDGRSGWRPPDVGSRKITGFVAGRRASSPAR